MRAGWTRRTWLGMALAAGLVAPAAPEAAEPLHAVATIGMVGDVVRNVGGERVEVTTLMGEGVDPHLYKTTRTDIARMLQADIVFYNGLMLEGKMTDALVRVAGAGRRVHAVTELLPESFLLEPPEFAGAFDPHVWMDPTAWTRSVEVIRDKLVEADPEGAEAYRAAAEAYAAELQRLDAYAEEVLASVPEERRVLVTAHDAFNYFGRRYGFRVEGIQGLSTDSEAGLRRIEELVDLLVELEIPAVFIESTIPVQTVQALVAGAAARGHEVVIGGSLFSDAMGAPGSYEGTYVGMIDHNVTVIARALGGSTPERGLNGQLAMRE
ncbi:metal ABC transporter solute-binding protein, Zn/Mn family [Marinimicrococcus flavescens]|uniref:Zinc ABC transporter substrate-binding protein n=1 Tax=Marinimicrococcus flavescens TaxID=3031815 RepID=A0AAP3UZM2_9PROT|nr:zinc ABC transporter substrate-binding protein [Marinimicrococcus flavescens]